MKALHVIEPPAKDCDWETKPEWRILRIIAGTHLSLFYCKNEKLDKSIEILKNLKGLLRYLDHYSSASKILYHIYSSLGLLFYKMDKVKKTRKYLEKGIVHLENFINKPKQIKPTDKDLIENYEEEMKNLEYCQLINLYLNYKTCKISFRLMEKTACFERLSKTLNLIELYREKLEYVETREYIFKYIEAKLMNVQKKLEGEMRKGLLNDLDQQIKEMADSFVSDTNDKKNNLPSNTNTNNSSKKIVYKIHEPKVKQKLNFKISFLLYFIIS